MKRKRKKIVIPRPKGRGMPVPPAKIIPNPKKEASLRRARKKVSVEDEED